jgi:hypothetical protein
MERGTFSINQACSLEFAFHFFTATVLRKASVSAMPEVLSALPEIFEEEKLTQGGLPNITSVSGRFSIAETEWRSSDTSFTPHSNPKFKLNVLDGRKPAVHARNNLESFLTKSFRKSAGSAK